MSISVEDLAQQIARLDDAGLQALLARLEELCLRHEVRLISERYQKRLREQSESDASGEEILKQLKRIREEMASREYQG